MTRHRRQGTNSTQAAALVLAAVAAAIFLAIAGAVVSGWSQGFDESVLVAFREAGDPGNPLGPAEVEEMARDVTGLGSTAVVGFAALAAIGLFLMQRKRHLAAYVALAVAGGALLSTLLKAGFDRPRPDLVVHGQAVFTSSFPSGHSMLSAVTFLTLGAVLAAAQSGRATRIYTLGLAAFVTVAVGVSRVYLGVHWPTDVLGGWAAGAAWALLCWVLERRLRARGRIE